MVLIKINRVVSKTFDTMKARHPINLRGDDDDDGVGGGLQILGSDKEWNGIRFWRRAQCAVRRGLIDHTLIECRKGIVRR